MIRTATTDDLALVRELCAEFGREVSDLPWRDDDSQEEFDSIEQALAEGGVLLADEDGIAVLRTRGAHLAELELLHVRPNARRSGVGHALVRAAAKLADERGLDTLELSVLEDNRAARRFYDRLGFATVERRAAAPVARLVGEAPGTTFGAVHVQTDDANAVARNVEKVLPRFGRTGTHEVSGAEGGWVRVRSDVTDADPEKLHALAKELSYMSGGVTLALGIEDGAVVRYNLFDRGSSVDEYASVPEYRGELPPGDVIALGANPTVVARLTGADPHHVREVARTAASPGELPPAEDLYRQIATLMGVTA